MNAFEQLIQNSPQFKQTQRECYEAVKQSLTGITNLVVNFEDSCLVNSFLENMFKKKELYRGSIHIDAVELQRDMAGQGLALSFIDQLIYGTFEDSGDNHNSLDANRHKLDKRTGSRERNQDGFVNRAEAVKSMAENKTLIIRNLDYSLDFCGSKPAHVDLRAVNILDKFRESNLRNGMRLLLITNKKLELPFKIRTVELKPVSDFEAMHILDGFIGLCESKGYQLILNSMQKEHICRKISGLLYTEAGDIIAESITASKTDDVINAEKLFIHVRDKVNKMLLEEGTGLSHLTPRNWEDYILPEKSNFTFDVKKILRDFNEISEIKDKMKKTSDIPELEECQKTIQSIRTRMPHVILLHGKGGVGKSAFAPHFAGLLGFDSWNFNVSAAHSKWVGVGAENMRCSLDRISNSTHMVCRIDEYDRAMGSTGNKESGMNEAHRQVESEFMNWLQDSQEENIFVKNDIFVVLTTNHKDRITGPLLRSGRIDLVIDISDFDEKSMIQSFITAPRRMKNRKITIIGFNDNYDALLVKIKSLDLDSIAVVAKEKGFTVGDIDMLIIEMAAHDYYYQKGGPGIEWNTENFIKVLEGSTGSTREDSTAELVLGDRFIFQKN